jgi:hypothetical protein
VVRIGAVGGPDGGYRVPFHIFLMPDGRPSGILSAWMRCPASRVAWSCLAGSLPDMTNAHEVVAAYWATRITDFWPEPYELPVGRAHLVERY